MMLHLEVTGRCGGCAKEINHMNGKLLLVAGNMELDVRIVRDKKRVPRIA